MVDFNKCNFIDFIDIDVGIFAHRLYTFWYPAESGHDFEITLAKSEFIERASVSFFRYDSQITMEMKLVIHDGNLLYTKQKRYVYTSRHLIGNMEYVGQMLRLLDEADEMKGTDA